MTRLITLLCALSLVISCGQSGKLYLPGEAQTSNVATFLPATDNSSES